MHHDCLLPLMCQPCSFLNTFAPSQSILCPWFIECSATAEVMLLAYVYPLLCSLTLC